MIRIANKLLFFSNTLCLVNKFNWTTIFRDQKPIENLSWFGLAILSIPTYNSKFSTLSAGESLLAWRRSGFITLPFFFLALWAGLDKENAWETLCPHISFYYILVIIDSTKDKESFFERIPLSLLWYSFAWLSREQFAKQDHFWFPSHWPVQCLWW